ncbi:MAG TPA: nucleotide exchange factor GrpE [Thermoanaerobaculia bacterium]|nr:nucleotide exchange factor GrpE [Thermoanaerobaculia bacterium]
MKDVEIADGEAETGQDDEIGPDTEVEILGVVDDDGAVMVDEEAYDEGGSASDDVDALRREIADLRDRSMRTLADFDNYRKRAERERSEVRRHVAAETIVDFLDVVDNLERALAAGGSADDLKVGVEMILRQLEDLLRRRGVERVAAKGEAFDPTVHEAVSRQEDPEISEPRVVEEMQSGYLMNDRLLRPARVVVAVPPEDD